MNSIFKSQCEFAKFSRVAQELSSKALGQLKNLILDLPKNIALFADSTHYERVDKLVLWNSEDKTLQLRLHIYTDQFKNADNLADISEAHNHRWNFSTRILSGGYSHTMYQMDMLENGKYALVPTLIRHEGLGSSYAMHHAQYHSIIEEPNTVSLILRGPIEKKSFQIVAKPEGSIHLKDSLSLQTTEEKSKRAMTFSQYEKILMHLFSLKII